MKAVWSDGTRDSEVPILGWEDVSAVLDTIRTRGVAVLLQLCQEGSGRELGIGLGRPDSVFTYQESLDPPYFISLGNPAAGGGTTFNYGGESTEYLGRNLVPESLVTPTIRAFLETRARPDTVEWEAL